MHAIPRALSSQRRARSWFTASVLAALLVPLACGSIREDELECEQTLSYLLECCPGFRSEGFACEYTNGCGSTTYPALPLAESKCLQARSCGQLVASGLCERAQNATPVFEDTERGHTTSRTPVCP